MQKQVIKILFCIFAGLMLFIASASATDVGLRCDIGPLQRTYDGSLWNMYACADSKSMVVISANAANGEAGYFFVTLDPEGSALTVVGEGWGSDSDYEPVFEELKKMSPSDLRLMISIAKTTAGLRDSND